jgi:hypothetical protein
MPLTKVDPKMFGTGGVLQVIQSQTAALINLSTLIPTDNTIPQSNEGAEILTATITPSGSSSKILVFANVFVSMSPANWSCAAIFQDAGVNALSATSNFQATNTAASNLQLVHMLIAGSTAATTIRLRVGPNSGTACVNGSAGYGIFGGVGNTTLTLMEIAG